MKTITMTWMCGLLLAFANTSFAKPGVGQAMPKISGLLPDAKLPDTAGKVVLVDFWASWCGPCKASFPALARLHQKYSGKGLVIIGIGVDDDVAKHQAFIAKQQVPFALVHDSRHKAAAFFAPSAMPSSYLVDRKGVIRFHHSGFKGAKTEAQYVQEIESLLNQ
ncbi:MAG: TlpA family protein disulfide reductase [Akkermansiaceae bacterium]